MVTTDDDDDEDGRADGALTPTDSPPTADDVVSSDKPRLEPREGRLGAIRPPIRPPVLLLEFHSQAAWDATDSDARTMILRRPDHDAVTALLEVARSQARAAVTTKWLALHGDLRGHAVRSGWRAAQSVEVAQGERGVWASLASGEVEGRCAHGATSNNCPINGCPHRPPPPSVDLNDYPAVEGMLEATVEVGPGGFGPVTQCSATGQRFEPVTGVSWDQDEDAVVLRLRLSGPSGGEWMHTTLTFRFASEEAAHRVIDLIQEDLAYTLDGTYDRWAVADAKAEREYLDL